MFEPVFELAAKTKCSYEISVILIRVGLGFYFKRIPVYRSSLRSYALLSERDRLRPKKPTNE